MVTIEYSLSVGSYGQGQKLAKNIWKKLWLRLPGLTPNRSQNTDTHIYLVVMHWTCMMSCIILASYPGHIVVLGTRLVSQNYVIASGTVVVHRVSGQLQSFKTRLCSTAVQWRASSPQPPLVLNCEDIDAQLQSSIYQLGPWAPAGSVSASLDHGRWINLILILLLKCVRQQKVHFLFLVWVCVWVNLLWVTSLT